MSSSFEKVQPWEQVQCGRTPLDRTLKVAQEKKALYDVHKAEIHPVNVDHIQAMGSATLKLELTKNKRIQKRGRKHHKNLPSKASFCARGDDDDGDEQHENSSSSSDVDSAQTKKQEEAKMHKEELVHPTCIITYHVLIHGILYARETGFHDESFIRRMPS